MEVSQEFARKSTCTQVDFKKLNFESFKTSIVEETGFPIDGEKWFKKLSFEAYLSLFLMPGSETLDWSKDIHFSALKEEWR